MSEPNGAFMKAKMDRPALVQWLASPPPSPSRWTDWRDIGGRWYLDSGLIDLRDAPASDLSQIIAEAGAMLAQCVTNRDALQVMFRPGASAYDAGFSQARHIAFDFEAREFTAGALFYSESLSDLVVFLTVARGCVSVLLPTDQGIAVVHDWIFSSEDGSATIAAMALGPGDHSGFLIEDERASAAAAFAMLVGAIMEEPDEANHITDHLDELR